MAADGVSVALAALNWGWATAISVFFHEYAYFLFLGIAVALYLAYPSVRRHRLKIAAFAVSLLLMSIIVVGVKNLWKVERPCDENLKLDECPSDYAFPSGHTAYAFIYAAASIGTSFFPLFLLLSIGVALSRMYLGIHSLNDVAAGLVIAFAVYFVIENWLKRKWPELIQERERIAEASRLPKRLQEGEIKAFELRRQLTHIVFGSGILLLLWLLGKNKTELVLLCASFLAVMAMHLRLERQRFPIIDEIFELFERPEVLPAKGALMYVLGSLLAFTFLPDPAQAAVAVAVLAWGDGAATAIGQFGNAKLPWNKKKTWLGSASFFLFAAAAGYLFLREAALLPALVAAVAETIDVPIDDNFLIPIVVTAWFLLV